MIKGSGLSQEDAAKLIGVSRQTLVNWFNMDIVSPNILQNVKLKLTPHLDHILVNINKPDQSNDSNIIIQKEDELNQIPMYNFPAAAGEVEVYGNPNDVKIVGYLNIPGAHKNSFALPAYGHSMYPTIANGDWAVNRPIEDTTEIVWGEIYYIEWADYKMYKRLLTGDNEDEVILWSDNQTDMIGNRPKYSPITIKKEKIRKLCIVTEILKKPNY